LGSRVPGLEQWTQGAEVGSFIGPGFG
jgi:hypothetical protein